MDISTLPCTRQSRGGNITGTLMEHDRGVGMPSASSLTGACREGRAFCPILGWDYMSVPEKGQLSEGHPDISH